MAAKKLNGIEILALRLTHGPRAATSRGGIKRNRHTGHDHRAPVKLRILPGANPLNAGHASCLHISLGNFSFQVRITAAG